MIPPEYKNEIHNSNRLIKIDARIREVIDYLKMYDQDDLIPGDVIITAIQKLDAI